jgi:hypothetical protein
MALEDIMQILASESFD